MRQPWRRRDFRLLLLGQTASAFGDWMGTIGFMALSLALTDSALAVGIVLVLRLLPTVVAGPLAVRLVDRLDRRRTMMTMDWLVRPWPRRPIRECDLVGLWLRAASRTVQRGVP